MLDFLNNLWSCCRKDDNNISQTSSTIQRINHRKKVSLRNSTKLLNYYGKGNSHITRDRNSMAASYPKDEVFLLGRYAKMIAKITTIRIDSGLEQPNAQPDSGYSTLGLDQRLTSVGDESNPDDTVTVEKRKEIFSLHDKGVQVEFWHERIPENVAKHIASRLKCGTIVDVFCEYGENAIQFAKVCDSVISIDVMERKTGAALHNSKVYKVNKKIEFRTENFLESKELRADIVFLNISKQFFHGSFKSDSFVGSFTRDNLPELIAKALKISTKVAMRVPGTIDLDELSDMFHETVDTYKLYTKRFCIEIEEIMTRDDRVDHILVLFGDCSSITENDEIQALYEELCCNESKKKKSRYTYHVMEAIFNRIGIYQALDLLGEIKNCTSIEKPILQRFLDQLIKEEAFTKSSLEQLVNETLAEKSLNSLSVISQDNTHRIDSIWTETPIAKYEQMAREEKAAMRREREKENESGSLNQNIELQARSMKEDYSKKLASQKDSRVISELAVSSYSVNSNFLNESAIEEEPEQFGNQEIFQEKENKQEQKKE